MADAEAATDPGHAAEVGQAGKAVPQAILILACRCREQQLVRMGGQAYDSACEAAGRAGVKTASAVPECQEAMPL